MTLPDGLLRRLWTFAIAGALAALTGCGSIPTAPGPGAGGSDTFRVGAASDSGSTQASPSVSHGAPSPAAPKHATGKVGW